MSKSKHTAVAPVVIVHVIYHAEGEASWSPRLFLVPKVALVLLVVFGALVVFRIRRERRRTPG